MCCPNLRNHRQRIVRAFSILFLLGVAWLGMVGQRGLQCNNPLRTRYPIRGIDVSHHQGRIRWSKIKSQEIRFAYLKATEGKDFIDRRFLENWRLARRAKIITGAYHFFTFCSSGKAQAEHFWSFLPKGQKMLIPAVDVEFGGNCRTWKSHE
ncbi:MAG: GH25 family lysozyme, partial [Myxococcota bacterium]